MNQDKINTIIIANSEINHIISSFRKDEYFIDGGSYFPINPFNRLSIDNALKEISLYVKNNRLTKLNIINDKILKSQFILNQNETSNLRIEVLNRFKTTFDISLNEYYTDFETYNFKNITIVFIAGINRQYLDPLLRNFKARKFQLLFLEVDIIALKRLISRSFPNEVIISAHMRDDKTIFIVSSNDILFAFRELNFGFQNIMDTLSEKTNIDKSKITNNLNFEDLPLSEALDKFTIELQRTIDFYNSQFRNDPISKLILTGKLLNFKGIESFLSRLFIIKTEKLNGLKKFVLNTDNKMIEKMNYITEALGSAMRDI